jgi:tetrahydromethanopterin S-methyltransferase subunit F
VLPGPPGDIQAPPLFHEIARAEGLLQQTTEDRIKGIKGGPVASVVVVIIYSIAQ